MKRSSLLAPAQQLLTLLLLVLLLIQCQVRPSNVLSRDRMRDLTRDLILTETYLDNNYLPDSIRALYYESVYQKHHITRADYDSSLVWYSKNSPILNSIYSELITEFQSQATALDSAIVDSTRLFRIRYQAPVSLWTNPSRLLLPSDKKLCILTQSLNVPTTGDTLDLRLRLTPLDSLQELHFALFVKDSTDHLIHRTRRSVPIGSTHYSQAFVLPDSLPPQATLLLQLLYLSRRDTPHPHTLIDSLTLTLREPTVLPGDTTHIVDPTDETDSPDE